jgi:hypothetical protein
MIRAYHAIWGVYGFWLPNDPRGSWSEFVASWELVQHGKPIGKSRRQIDHQQLRAWRSTALASLRYPAVRLTGRQGRSVGIGFGNAVRKSDFTMLACSILPQHVHVVLGRHTFPAERVCTLLKGEATKQLNRDGIHPLADFARDGKLPSLWQEGQWLVFLDNEEALRRAIRYVEENPVKEGKRLQRWSFVTPFTGDTPIA